MNAQGPKVEKDDEQTPDPWVVLVVEDNEQFRKDIVEEFNGTTIDSRTVSIRQIETFEVALREVAERKADLVILDVYKGNPLHGGQPLGFDVLEALRATGFASVVIYTAIPEAAKDYASPFVWIVGKDDSGVAGLRKRIEELFATKVPHVFRAIVSHLDSTLRDYMWGFVEKNWGTLEPISAKPEFLRLLVHRMAASLSREGIDSITSVAFGMPEPGKPLGDDQAHPAEYYVIPPVGQDIRFGDIRVFKDENDGEEIRVVVWPSCDLVTTGGRSAKTTHVSCALATKLSDSQEMKDWIGAPSEGGKRKAVGAMLRNERMGKGITPERFHFLPAFAWIPDLVVDFQAVERLPVAKVAQAKCVATIASPFAEHLGGRYLSYIGRLGVPDLDAEGLLTRLAPVEGAKK